MFINRKIDRFVVELGPVDAAAPRPVAYNYNATDRVLSEIYISNYTSHSTIYVYVYIYIDIHINIYIYIKREIKTDTLSNLAP